MLVRPLDENGDILPVSNISDMTDGKKAVAEVIDLRLNFMYGEWWEDRTMGFRVPEFLLNGARRGDVNLLSKYIASYVSNSPEIRAVTNIVSAFDGHKMTFYCVALTVEGENTTVEVNLDGVL